MAINVRRRAPSHLSDQGAVAETALTCTEDPPDPASAPIRCDHAAAEAPSAKSGGGVVKTTQRIVPLADGRRQVARFPRSPRAASFQKTFFPETNSAEWNNWRWQLQNRIRNEDRLAQIFRLSEDERQGLISQGGALPLGITPYYASLLSQDDADDPLRRTHIPVGAERLFMPGEESDPLGEDHHAVVPGLIHRYPDRVLFLVTGSCATYCRYCTRSRAVGGNHNFNTSQWEEALAYIEAHTEVRDVLISGGDPLTLSDDKLNWLLGRIRRIPHVEFLRIGTKTPVTLPMRITRDLVHMLARHHPLWMSIHFIHPAELTTETTEACRRLADAGIPLGSQTVLLKGINDNVDTVKTLMQGLLKRRVRPYYLYQCDPVRGSAHFRTPVEKGLEIIRGLRGFTSGYAVPHFVIDAPGGGGKVPLLPDYVMGRDGDDLLVGDMHGNAHRYPDPGGAIGKDKGSAAV